MHVWDAIQTKRAIRDFKDEPLSEEHVERILQAGRRSQSSKNSQPWHFIAVQDKERLQKVSELGDWMGHVAGAAFCIVIVVPEENERTIWHFFDAGQSASYMQLAATEIGVGSCLGTIYKPQEAKDLLGIPDDHQTRIVISFGYPVDETKVKKPLTAYKRRDLDDVVHWETW